MNIIDTKYLVLGSGVTGLAFANFIHSEDFLILEKEAEPGGYCKTIVQDGFVWDYAGHFFHFRTGALKRFFEKKLPSEQFVEQKKHTHIYYGGKLIDFPFQMNIHQLPMDEFLDCLHDLFFAENDSAAESFKDMLYQTYGKSICDKFLVPYNEKLYSCDLNKLDKDSMGRFFPKSDLADIIRNFVEKDLDSYNATFLYPRKGAMVFVNALLESIDKSNLNLNEEVTGVDIERKTVTTTRHVYRYEYLLSSIPFHSFFKLYDPASCENETAELSSNKVLVFNLGFDRPSLLDSHWVYFPQQEIRFYRVGFYDRILGLPRMSIYVEVGLRENAVVDLKEERQIVLEDLRKVGIIKEHKLISSSALIMDPAYVHISKKSGELIEREMERLAGKQVFLAGRYGQWKYCSIEDSMLDAKQLAEMFNKEK
jgi:protoporphyrinogen oxidase